MAKLKEPILFIVIPPGYNRFIKVYADWETEKSFGIRGESFDCVRYTRSTGEMYNKSTSVKEKESNDKMNGKPITVIEFDSCEYVGFFDGSGYHYTHKGNCKYCAERSLK